MPRMVGRRVMRLLLPWVVAILVGCASTVDSSKSPVPAAAPTRLADEELRALVLLLGDRLVFEELTVGRALEAGAEARRELALVLGRIGDPQGLVALRRLARDESAEVRRAAVFSLGRVGASSSRPVLLVAAADEDRACGELAVAALASIGVGLPEVLNALRGLPSVEVQERLLPQLHRFSGLHAFAAEEVRGVAIVGLRSAQGEARRRSAFALSRVTREGDADLWRSLLGDDDSGVRSLAAGALGEFGRAADLAALAELLDDPSTDVVVAALSGAARLISTGRVAPPEEWKPLLLALFDDGSLAVRGAALRAAAAWLLDDRLAIAMRERAEHHGIEERMAALGALAVGGDPQASDLLVKAVLDDNRYVRTLAPQAAPRLMTPDLYSELEYDSFAGVRQAAFSVHLDRTTDELAVLGAVLADPDGGVRAAALQWLEANPRLPVETLVSSLAGPGREVTELTLSGVDALVARALVEPTERGTIVAVLEALGVAEEYLIRRQAAKGLERLGRPPTALGEASDARSTGVYADILRRTRSDIRLAVTTERGTFVVRLDCPSAPLTCLSFAQLAQQGFYDDLPFHRVVPSVLVEGGDPRRDGWGGPGFRLRDEIHPGRLVRGTVVMSRRLPHTAGSIFRILLADAPDLEGELTAFGTVESGLEVVESLEHGDLILGMRDLAGAGR